jgi:hypothetical protein
MNAHARSLPACLLLLAPLAGWPTASAQSDPAALKEVRQAFTWLDGLNLPGVEGKPYVRIHGLGLSAGARDDYEVLDGFLLERDRPSTWPQSCGASPARAGGEEVTTPTSTAQPSTTSACSSSVTEPGDWACETRLRPSCGGLARLPGARREELPSPGTSSAGRSA